MIQLKNYIDETMGIRCEVGTLIKVMLSQLAIY